MQMTAKELKEALANVPDDAEVYMDLGGVNAIGVSGAEFDEYQYAVYIY
jgi:hypothetical protein